MRPLKTAVYSALNRRDYQYEWICLMKFLMLEKDKTTEERRRLGIASAV
jgi:hypothetical protein